MQQDIDYKLLLEKLMRIALNANSAIGYCDKSICTEAEHEYLQALQSRIMQEQDLNK